MKIVVVTLFPEFFAPPLSTGLVGKALAAGRATVQTIDPRTFTHDRHRTVDDTPYGGGGGMVMKPGPVVRAIRARPEGTGPVVLLSPQGRPLVQADFQRWAAGPSLVLVSGRYEGFDERIRAEVDEEVSLGDFVLTGGEYAALAVIDGVVRLLPGTLGNKDSPEQDSFSDGLLEYPHYTRPVEFEGVAVPEVLQSGHHQQVAEWRHAQSLRRTRVRRPDLLRHRGLSPAEAAVLRPIASPPVLLAVPARWVDAALLAVATAYDLARVVVVVDGEAARAEVQAGLKALPRARYPVRQAPRPRKLRRAPPAEADVDLSAITTVVVGWSAVPSHWAGQAVRRYAAARRPSIDAQFELPDPVFRGCDHVPCLMVDAPPEVVDRYLPVVRGPVEANRLPVPVAVAIYLDRIIGES